MRKQLVTERPRDLTLKCLLGHVKEYLGQLLMHTGRPAEGEELLKQAVEIDEQLLHDFPDVVEYRRRTFTALERYADLLTSLGRAPEAETALRRCLAIREERFAE